MFFKEKEKSSSSYPTHKHTTTTITKKLHCSIFLCKNEWKIFILVSIVTNRWQINKKKVGALYPHAWCIHAQNDLSLRCVYDVCGIFMWWVKKIMVSIRLKSLYSSSSGWGWLWFSSSSSFHHLFGILLQDIYE